MHRWLPTWAPRPSSYARARGRSAKLVSRFRPLIDIIAMTTNDRSYRKLALSWGVLPLMSEEYTSVDVLFHFAKCAAKNSGLVKKGDVIVITAAAPTARAATPI